MPLLAFLRQIHQRIALTRLALGALGRRDQRRIDQRSGPERRHMRLQTRVDHLLNFMRDRALLQQATEARNGRVIRHSTRAVETQRPLVVLFLNGHVAQVLT